MNAMKKLYQEWRALQPLKSELQRQMDQQFMIDFNYNSNHLEGNTLTYGQTKLLLLFGDTIGNASMQDYEEMKAHNVGLELMKLAAIDKTRALTETFIRELNKTILVRDFYKTSRDGEYRYKIHVGVYKTRPNSVITPTGEVFDYASPEETSALMSDLVGWYNEEERKEILSPVELSALFHYRYIRIHPFEDGNGRIARLLVNYILLRHNYPMIVIRTDDRVNYLKMLHQCDLLTGKIPSDGATATFEQTRPLIDYITDITENKLIAVLQLAKGKITEIIESKNDDVPEKTLDSQQKTNNGQNNVPDNVPDNVPEIDAQKRQKLIINFIKMNNKISSTEIAGLLKVNSKTVKRDFQQLKNREIIKRIGSDRGGHWEIIK